LGSATQLVNQAQSIVNSYFTTAWGEDLINQRPLADRYGFVHRERDDESALIHFRARAYDPRLGRFVQKDPVLEIRASEHYRYVANNPTGATDPLGERLCVQGVDERIDALVSLLSRWSGRTIIAREPEKSACVTKSARQIADVTVGGGGGSQHQNAFRVMLEGLLSTTRSLGRDVEIALNVVSGSAEVIDNYSQALLDVGDLQDLDALEAKLTRVTWSGGGAQQFVHVAYEQLLGHHTSFKGGAGRRTEFELAHDRALTFENQYRELAGLDGRIDADFSPFIQDIPGVGRTTYNFRYSIKGEKLFEAFVPEGGGIKRAVYFRVDEFGTTGAPEKITILDQAEK
jgi:RHS repeat-associated protein